MSALDQAQSYSSQDWDANDLCFHDDLSAVISPIEAGFALECTADATTRPDSKRAGCDQDPPHVI